MSDIGVLVLIRDEMYELGRLSAAAHIDRCIETETVSSFAAALLAEWLLVWEGGDHV